mmetsp:Transcript_3995/g.5421  ORF Transcript_3995/g.5421 Transcript_3995/m.5421 type:complete len:94 (+) Transcript_3995:125-406(+)
MRCNKQTLRQEVWSSVIGLFVLSFILNNVASWYSIISGTLYFLFLEAFLIQINRLMECPTDIKNDRESNEENNEAAHIQSKVKTGEHQENCKN